MRGIVTEASALLLRDLTRFRRKSKVSTKSKSIKKTMANKVYTTDCVVKEELLVKPVVEEAMDDEVFRPGAICKMDFTELTFGKWNEKS